MVLPYSFYVSKIVAATLKLAAAIRLSDVLPKERDGPLAGDARRLATEGLAVVAVEGVTGLLVGEDRHLAGSTDALIFSTSSAGMLGSSSPKWSITGHLGFSSRSLAIIPP